MGCFALSLLVIIVAVRSELVKSQYLEFVEKSKKNFINFQSAKKILRNLIAANRVGNQ